MAILSFKPKQVIKELLASLPERSRDVLIGRFGLGKPPEQKTLEAIGKKYNITRERVRQIENHAISSICRSDAYKEVEGVFRELSGLIDEMGGIISEQDLLSYLAKDESMKNHIHFLLVLGDYFTKLKETDEFLHSWHVDEELSSAVQQALRGLYASLSDEELVSEPTIIDKLFSQMSELNERYRNEEIARRWLSLSKKISKNPLGEWGRADSSNVRVKGMRDYAYLAIKRHGSPMHFREVASTISELFNKKAHEATCHNELIKDPRFVLVGRGLYALSEWGYTEGVVKDVIKEILHNEGPLSRESIMDRVKKERYVKDNTILVNLQDATLFKRLPDGTYILT